MQINNSVENYFSLENATHLHCHIKDYSASLRNLTIGISRSEEEELFGIINFTSTFYIDAPTAWDNANFTLETSRNCVGFLRQFREYDELGDDYLADFYNLYQVRNGMRSITIVASKAKFKKLVSPA